MILVHKYEICPCVNLHPLARRVRDLVVGTGVPFPRTRESLMQRPLGLSGWL